MVFVAAQYLEAVEKKRAVFRAVFSEMKKLSEKKPEATLRKTKVTVVNRILTDVKECLSDEEDAKYLDFLEDEQLPQYSDVVLIMSQYDAALTKFRRRYYGRDAYGQEGWFVKMRSGKPAVAATVRTSRVAATRTAAPQPGLPHTRAVIG